MFIGHLIYYYPTIGSTMDKAHRLAQEGVPEGAIVLADEQTAGRGRLRRSWWAPAGSSLLLSLVLRPPFAPRHAQRLTMVCSLAVCDAIAQVSGLQALVKWPNDVLVGGRKVCGILTELDVLGDELRYAIVGIGINVNVDFDDAPTSVTPPLGMVATSLLMETGRSVSRLDVLVALLSGIERRYLAIQKGKSFHREWAERMATLGQFVQACDGSERWSGLAVGVDEDGALLVRLGNGRTRRLLAGDVTLREPGR